MRTLLTAMLAGALLLVTGEGIADAKCYRFRNAPSDVGVCVRGDSFAARKKARRGCTKKVGGDCGSVSSYRSSCHSNANRCYDHDCNAKRSLRGYITGPIARYATSARDRGTKARPSNKVPATVTRWSRAF